MPLRPITIPALQVLVVGSIGIDNLLGGKYFLVLDTQSTELLVVLSNMLAKTRHVSLPLTTVLALTHPQLFNLETTQDMM